MVLQGHASLLYSNELRMFWNPAPPKFSCPPALVKLTIFPKYEATRPYLLNEGFDEVLVGDDIFTKPSAAVEKVLFKKSQSATELSADRTAPSAETSAGQQQASSQVTRPLSAPQLQTGPETSLKLRSDYTTITRELQVAHQQLFRSAQAPADGPTQTSDLQVDPRPPSSQLVVSHPLQQTKKRGSRRSRGGVGRGGAGRTKPSRVKGLSPAKLAHVQQILSLTCTLTRTESLCVLPTRPPPAPSVSRPLPRRPSVPPLLDFEAYAAERGGIPAECPTREWVRDIWEAWFDEVFPPLEEDSSCQGTEETRGTRGALDALWRPEEVGSTLVDHVDLSQALEGGLTPGDLEAEVEHLTQILEGGLTPGNLKADVGCPTQTLEGGLTPGNLEAEVGCPTQALEGGLTPGNLVQPLARQRSPFHLCRRGALYKKLGRLSRALDDLNAAISLEPLLLDTYWHRHSIYLLRNDQDAAMKDLNVIIKHNRRHADAFKSKAEIYRSRGETSLAIENYSQAIRCRPEDDDSYFRRAEMREKRNETLLAMDDYAKTFAANPARTDALMTRGLHYFNSSAWRTALADFHLLLQHQPGHARARTYRGRIYAKLGQYHEALEDFSQAVNLDPYSWRALYHRGCLIRETQPDMALRDLSISVLINNNKENLDAFLHRGLLYTEMGQWQQAISDFKAVIKLDRTVAVAHVNLGLIYMLELNQNQEAIRMFSRALRADPTHVRGYLCRAQAYRNVKDLKRAVRDLTCVAHMRPDTQHVHIMRGQLYCDLEQFEQATFLIHYVAEISKGLGSSPIQQAVVESFLGKDTEAIACLEAAADRGAPPILILLGKTQMKAGQFTEAVESFRKALALLSPGHTSKAAEVCYQTGLCYMALGLLQQAVDVFSHAVRLRPDFADALHQRGLCRVRLRQTSSLQDLNMALCVLPGHFQVYLSRAALYGARRQYSKAILSCNEALRSQPRSVRAYLYRGALKFYTRGYEEAIADLTMAIRIDNTCSFAYYNRGTCYQQLKRYELALRDYSTVLLLPSREELHLKVLINRAVLYVELGDHHHALQDFREASERSPEDATLHHTLGVFHHRQGQLEESVAAYSRAVHLSPFYLEAYVGRGGAYMDFGHAQANKQAQRDYLVALRLDPLCCSARVSLAYNLQALGRFQRAWNQFTVAVELEPASWTALEGRAVVNLQMGDAFAAFQDISLALRLKPDSEQLLTNRGVIHQFRGDRPRAMADYQAAIRINPRYSLAYFNAANLYLYNRQFTQACEYYDRALELDPGDECAVLNRAITRALLRRVPEALQDFSRALELSPSSSHVYFNRANLYSSLQDHTLAEQDLTKALELQPRDALLYQLRADARGRLGCTELAVQDYRTSLELQDSLEVT